MKDVRFATGGGRNLNASLDDVRIWNTSRTIEQISSSKNCELQGNETGLVAYYNFNQGNSGANNTVITSLIKSVSGGANGTWTSFTLTGSSSNWLAGSPVTTGSIIPGNPTVTTPVVYNQGDTSTALTATIGTNGSGLLWYTTATGGTGTTTAPTPNTTIVGNTSYWVSSTNANGCESERVEILVTVNGPSPQIVITEIMYNPPMLGADDTEFIELYNAGSTTVDLTGFTFSQGVTHTFTSGSINAGAYIIITVNQTELDDLYGAGTADAQWTLWGLSNGGEDIELKDASGNIIDYVDYDDQAPWPTEPDGTGPSLRLCDLSSDNSLASNWSASTEATGLISNAKEIKVTPGQASNCNSLNVIKFISPIEISLYPNPAKQIIVVKLNEFNKASLTVYDLSGRLILNKNLDSSLTNLNVSGFATGVYLFKIKTDKGEVIKRIVKQ